MTVPPPTRPRWFGGLRRSPSRMVGGVAGGLAEFWWIDPVVLRVAFAAPLATAVLSWFGLVLTEPIFGGLAVPLTQLVWVGAGYVLTVYCLAWVAIPPEEGPSAVRRALGLRGPRAWATWLLAAGGAFVLFCWLSLLLGVGRSVAQALGTGFGLLGLLMVLGAVSLVVAWLLRGGDVRDVVQRIGTPGLGRVEMPGASSAPAPTAPTAPTAPPAPFAPFAWTEPGAGSAPPAGSAPSAPPLPTPASERTVVFDQEPTDPTAAWGREPSEPAEPSEPTGVLENVPTDRTAVLIPDPTVVLGTQPTDPTVVLGTQPTDPTVALGSEPTEPTVVLENVPTDRTAVLIPDPTVVLGTQPTDPTVALGSEPTEPTVVLAPDPTFALEREPTEPGDPTVALGSEPTVVLGQQPPEILDQETADPTVVLVHETLDPTVVLDHQTPDPTLAYQPEPTLAYQSPAPADPTWVAASAPPPGPTPAPIPTPPFGPAPGPIPDAVQRARAAALEAEREQAAAAEAQRQARNEDQRARRRAARAVRRERNRWGRLVAAVTLITAGGLIITGRLGITDLDVLGIGVVCLALLTLGVLVGSVFGSGRWLILPALLLSVPLAAGAYLETAVEHAASAPAVRYVPGSLPAGQQELTHWNSAAVTVDLTQTKTLDNRTLGVQVDRGSLTVLVPSDQWVSVHADVVAGTNSLATPIFTVGDVPIGSSGHAELGPPQSSRQPLLLYLQVGIGDLAVKQLTVTPKES